MGLRHKVIEIDNLLDILVREVTAGPSIVTDEVRRGVGRFSDLEEGVLSVLSLTGRAEVVVVTLSALVADASDRSHSTSIAGDALVHFLRRLAFELTVDFHKLSVADCLDFFLYHLGHFVINTLFFGSFYWTRLFLGQILSRLLS